jgi:hypothetical protein
VLVGAATGGQRDEVGASGIDISDDGRKGGGVAPRILRAGGLLGMRAGAIWGEPFAGLSQQ